MSSTRTTLLASRARVAFRARAHVRLHAFPAVSAAGAAERLLAKLSVVSLAAAALDRSRGNGRRMERTRLRDATPAVLARALDLRSRGRGRPLYRPLIVGSCSEGKGRST